MKLPEVRKAVAFHGSPPKERRIPGQHISAEFQPLHMPTIYDPSNHYAQLFQNKSVLSSPHWRSNFESTRHTDGHLQSGSPQDKSIETSEPTTRIVIVDQDSAKMTDPLNVDMNVLADWLDRSRPKDMAGAYRMLLLAKDLIRRLLKQSVHVFNSEKDDLQSQLQELSEELTRLRNELKSENQKHSALLHDRDIILRDQTVNFFEERKKFHETEWKNQVLTIELENERDLRRMAEARIEALRKEIESHSDRIISSLWREDKAKVIDFILHVDHVSRTEILRRLMSQCVGEGHLQILASAVKEDFGTTKAETIFETIFKSYKIPLKVASPRISASRLPHADSKTIDVDTEEIGTQTEIHAEFSEAVKMVDAIKNKNLRHSMNNLHSDHGNPSSPSKWKAKFRASATAGGSATHLVSSSIKLRKETNHSPRGQSPRPAIGKMTMATTPEHSTFIKHLSAHLITPFEKVARQHDDVVQDEARSSSPSVQDEARSTSPSVHDDSFPSSPPLTATPTNPHAVPHSAPVQYQDNITKLIPQIYGDKIVADDICLREGKPCQDMKDFIKHFFFRRYGLLTMAAKQHKELIQRLQLSMQKSLRIRSFAINIGLVEGVSYSQDIPDFYCRALAKICGTPHEAISDKISTRHYMVDLERCNQVMSEMFPASLGLTPTASLWNTLLRLSKLTHKRGPVIALETFLAHLAQEYLHIAKALPRPSSQEMEGPYGYLIPSIMPAGPVRSAQEALAHAVTSKLQDQDASSKNEIMMG